jgi:hypothetical protein
MVIDGAQPRQGKNRSRQHMHVEDTEKKIKRFPRKPSECCRRNRFQRDILFLRPRDEWLPIGNYAANNDAGFAKNLAAS